MITGLWGKKIGMTQLFAGDKVVPVTAIDASHWIVTGFKLAERDGYSAVQMGLIKKAYREQTFSSDWMKKPNQYFSVIKEIRLKEDLNDVVVGQPANFCANVVIGENVDVFGTTKGCGFAGVVKRHDFNGPPGSHGSTMGKRPGSLSFMRSQGRVIKGKRMPGRMGNERVGMQNLEIIRIEADSGVILVKGSVPGRSGSLVFIRKA